MYYRYIVSLGIRQRKNFENQSLSADVITTAQTECTYKILTTYLNHIQQSLKTTCKKEFAEG